VSGTGVWPGTQLFLAYEGWASTVGGKTYNSMRTWGKVDPNRELRK